MKKLVLLLIATSIVACGGDKKKSTENTEAVITDNYSVVLDAIYEKDDSIVAFYKLDEYFKYDNPINLKIKGSPSSQKLVFKFPEGTSIEDLNLIASTSKDQSNITITNISVMNNDSIVVDGTNYKHSEYFLSDPSFSWDDKNQRYNLNHSNKYPPGFVGSDKLKSLLLK